MSAPPVHLIELSGPGPNHSRGGRAWNQLLQGGGPSSSAPKSSDMDPWRLVFNATQMEPLQFPHIELLTDLLVTEPPIHMKKCSCSPSDETLWQNPHLERL